MSLIPDNLKNSKLANWSLKYGAYFAGELFILFLLIFSINNYLGNPDDHIGNADGKGYYDYLPSLLIRHDLDRKDYAFNENSELYSFVSEERNGFYVKYEDKYVNKYPAGTALLQLPFFLFEYWTSTTDKKEMNGYEHGFQTSVFHASLFYLFMALFFLKLFLKELKVKIWIIFFIQLLIALGTNVTFYTYFDSSFSHVYSLFAINAFVYFSYKYFNSGMLKYFIWACVFFGLILNIRQVNLLVIFILPFVAGSWVNLKQKVILVFTKPKVLLIGIGLLFSIVFIQFYLWYLQTGDWVVYSYQNESFDFSKPHFIDILFSYKKGLFLYTPIAFVTVMCSFWLLAKKKYYLFATWTAFFVLITFILSSWWSWFFGCSFGHRAYIEFYGIMFIPFALFLNKIKTWIGLLLLPVCLLTIPLNLIQSYQYSKYILHWIDMDKEKYWKVFLETEEKYQGLVWVEEFDIDHLNVVQKIELGTVQLLEDGINVSYKYKIADFAFDFRDVSYIIVKLTGVIGRETDARLRLFINDMWKGEYYFMHEPYLLHFAHSAFGVSQVGYYKYAFPKMENITNDELEVSFFNSTMNTEFTDVELIFCK